MSANKVRRFSRFGVVFAVLGSTSTSPLAAESAEAKYREALDYCAGANLIRLDDRVSPANVVASALVTLCRQATYAQFQAVASMHTASYWQGYHEAAAKLYTTYVLQNRSGSLK